MESQALEGIMVADFSWVVAGPMTTKFLADHGATVVRVESTRHPCPSRSSTPYKDGVSGIDRSGWFAFINANKYSLALDLSHPRANEVTKRLVAWADIVTESLTPGAMEKLGLTYEELRKIRPDTIMLRTSQQGQTGPHATMPGYGVQLSGLTGFTHVTGYPDREVMQPFGAYNDLVTPYFCATALIAALEYRRKHGEGLLLDVSQYEAGLQFLTVPLLNFTANARASNRMGNRDYAAVPHNAYRCRGDDEWCAISVSSSEEWFAFCDAIGNPAWIADSRFSTLPARKLHEDEIDRLVEEWTCNYTADEVMTIMQTAGVASGVVKKPKDIREDVQLRERGFFWQMDHRELGVFAHLGEAFRMSGTPAEPRKPAPCLGEDTYYACTTFLGLSDSEFAELMEAGVFQ